MQKIFLVVQQLPLSFSSERLWEKLWKPFQWVIPIIWKGTWLEQPVKKYYLSLESNWAEKERRKHQKVITAKLKPWDILRESHEALKHKVLNMPSIWPSESQMSVKNSKRVHRFRTPAKILRGKQPLTFSGSCYHHATWRSQFQILFTTLHERTSAPTSVNISTLELVWLGQQPTQWNNGKACETAESPKK